MFETDERSELTLPLGLEDEPLHILGQPVWLASCDMTNLPESQIGNLKLIELPCPPKKLTMGTPRSDVRLGLQSLKKIHGYRICQILLE
jgi:hypothetical protein